MKMEQAQKQKKTPSIRAPKPVRRHKLMAFTPAFGPKRVKELDEVACAKRASRLFMLHVLTKTPEELMNIARGGQECEEAYINLIETIDGFIEHTKAVLSLAETAQARLLAVATVVVEEEERAAKAA